MTTIDDTGLTRTRLDERLAALEAAWRTIFGADIDLAPESLDGQVLGIFSEIIADQDSLLEAIYNGRSPAGAVGAALSRLVMLNGVSRKPFTFSTAPITLGGTPGTVIPMGSLIASSDTISEKDSVFETVAPYTIGGGGTVAGTVRATTPGAVPAGPGNLTIIQSVISGWTTAINATAATPGTEVETDQALRIRRAESVAISSQGILDGLYAALLQIADVTQVAVYENPTDIIDSNGLSRHSIHAIVLGGDPADIAEAIWLKKSLGVTQVGAEAVDIVDSQGQTQTMRFDRPVDTPIYVRVELAVMPNAGTVTAIKNAIVSWGQATSKIGAPVIWSQVFIPINTIPGLSVVNLFLDDVPSPAVQLGVVVPYNALATWDTLNIEIAQA